MKKLLSLDVSRPPNAFKKYAKKYTDYSVPNTLKKYVDCVW